MFGWHYWVNSTLIFWAAIVAIVFIGNFFGYRERTSRHRMIETLAEKGQPIPPEYFGYGRYEAYGRHYWRYRNPIASGILLMCIGIALAVFLWGMTGGGNPFIWDNGGNGHPPSWLPFVGIFPFMVGLARLLAGIFDRPPRDIPHDPK